MSEATLPLLVELVTAVGGGAMWLDEMSSLSFREEEAGAAALPALPGAKGDVLAAGEEAALLTVGDRPAVGVRPALGVNSVFILAREQNDRN